MKKRIHKGPSIGIVVSKFNEIVTRRLLHGCLDELQKRGVVKKNIRVVYVPGAFEIPGAALRLAREKGVDAVICLGAVIRGETYHFEVIAQSAAYGIMQAGLLTGKPVIFGVLTTDTVNQAYSRSDDRKDHKGRDAAVAALEMLNISFNGLGLKGQRVKEEGQKIKKHD